MSSVYLLVSHGSRDLRPRIAVAQLAQEVSSWLVKRYPATVKGQFKHTQSALLSPPLVATACLELATQPLHLAIVDFAINFSRAGIDRVVILPLFLLSGVHVMEDIPTEIALARQKVDNRVELDLLPYLGSCTDIDRLLIPQRQSLPAASILFAHGSRRVGGNEMVESIAERLAMKTAYWMMEPSLADRVANFVTQGAAEIGILPYFLFPGGITDAIIDLVAQLQLKFPQTKLILGEPIGFNPYLIDIIGEILLSSELSKYPTAIGKKNFSLIAASTNNLSY